MDEITSRKNKNVLDAVLLHDKRHRDKQCLFFTEGEKLLSEALGEGIMPLRVFVTHEFIENHGELISLLDTELFCVTDEVYDKITDQNSPEGVFAIFEKRNIEKNNRPASILLLEGVQDPGNLGTLVRTAVAFGTSEVITVDCADIYSPKAVRSTMGAVFKIPCSSFDGIDSAVEYAREKSTSIIAATLSADSVPITQVDTSMSTIMIGSEGRGLSKRAVELADKRVIIPIENIESLNASVAGAIFMYDSMMKRKNI